MFDRLRRWLFSLRDETVRELGRQLVDAEMQSDELAKTLEGVNRTCREIMAERDTAERLLNAVAKGIGFEPFDQSWRESPAAAMHAVGAHIDAKLSAIELRASKAEKDAEDLRAALASERHEHEKTTAAKEVAEAQNEAVWQVNELDRARRAAEVAIQNRRKAQAETDARRPPDDDQAA